MASKGQLTGMAGVYYAAAELSKMGFIVTPTARNAQGIDLLIANHNGPRVYSAQVKTNAKTFGFWLLSEKNTSLQSKTLFYIFINLRKTGVEYYVVPSKLVVSKILVSKSKSKKTGKESTWYSFYMEHAQKYRDKWIEAFRNPESDRASYRCAS